MDMKTNLRIAVVATITLLVGTVIGLLVGRHIPHNKYQFIRMNEGVLIRADPSTGNAELWNGGQWHRIATSPLPVQ
jgi:hypothetical protein